MTGSEHYREAERLLAGRTFPADPELHIEERHRPPTTEELLAAIGHGLLAKAPTDESAELIALRGFARQVRTIAQFGDMSTTARQELTTALAELTKDGAR